MHRTIVLVLTLGVLSVPAPAQAQAQVLTWTAGNDVNMYTSAPATAVAGPATIVFENSAATGNTTGMQHTLTFETGNPAYNSDVNVNILADPFDSNGGRHQVEVVLTPGRYRYFCAIPGHSAMFGELVVTEGEQDTTPPTVTAAVTGEQDANGDYVGSATVTLSAADEGSGVDSVEYSLDGGAFTQYEAPVTVDQLGEHTVSYRATDHAGNSSAVQQVSFTIVESGDPDPPGDDTTPPTVTADVSGERNADGAYVGAATVTLTATDDDSGVDRIEYALDGGAFGAYTAPVTVNQPGQHTVRYRATDLARNTSAVAEVSFTVVEPSGADTTPPVVAASLSGFQDADGDYVGSARVTLSATDDGSGVERVEYALDAGAFAAYTAPVTVDQPGEHTLSYRATDRAGNTSGTGSVTFGVAANLPDPQCPVPDTRPTVVIGLVNSKVPNRAVERACTINNLIEDERAWDSQDEFVDHVELIVDHLRHQRLITKREHAKLIRTAGRSGVGMPDTQNGYRAILDDTQRSFTRWEQVGAGGFTRNPDGSITSRAEPGLGMLWYPVKPYGNFSLRLQWRDDAPGSGRANSGVFVRFPWLHGHPDESRPEWVAIKYGHEVQILDRVDGDQYKTGSIYGFDRVDLAGAYQTPKGTWNDYEIRVTGQRYMVFRNGRLINEYLNVPGVAFSPPRAGDPGSSGRQHMSGYIGLQNHGSDDVVSFRNVRIAELPPCPAGETSC